MNALRGLLSLSILTPEENAIFDKATPTLGWPEVGIDCDGRNHLGRNLDFGLRLAVSGNHRDSAFLR